ncbi:MAG TPA: hypothetical protein VN541_05265 [Tepidisphaeraceae bacterium]|nr:hypothetical protein [Tepidisphaeraceae bacterium]
MHEEAHHCPFLNRADVRCSAFFSLDRLGYAFAHCFSGYQSCGVYAELLGERRTRRANAGAGRDGPDVSTPYVQLTLHGQAASHRHCQHAA